MMFSLFVFLFVYLPVEMRWKTSTQECIYVTTYLLFFFFLAHLQLVYHSDVPSDSKLEFETPEICK